MQSRLFRKSALERLSSPEQLDQLMQVTTPRSWLALLALLALVGVALGWALFGTIPTVVTGQGMLLQTGGVTVVWSLTTGQLSELQVAIGDIVQEGEVIGRVRPWQRAQNDAVPIVSPRRGRVVETIAGRGDYVREGEPVVILSSVNEDLEVVLYLPLESGQQVRPGMEARVSPSSIRKEEYGFMLGTVRSVGEFPATPQRMQRVLGSEPLVERFLGNGLPLEVRVEPIQDSDTVSGYKWSSPAGPPTTLKNGTPVQASVIVREQRPLHLLIPIGGR